MKEKLNLKDASKALIEAVIKTYSDMVFMDVAEVPYNDRMPDNPSILSIDILKPLSGKIQMFLSDDLKKRIVENILGKKQRLNEKETDDCLLEILNVLTGTFLTVYFGKDINYKMKLPEFFVNYQENENEDFILLHFDAEGLPFKVILKSVRYRY